MQIRLRFETEIIPGCLIPSSSLFEIQLLKLQSLREAPKVRLNLKGVFDINFVNADYRPDHLLFGWEVQVQMEAVDVMTGELPVGIAIAVLPLLIWLHLIHTLQFQGYALLRRLHIFKWLFLAFPDFINWVVVFAGVLLELRGVKNLLIVLLDFIDPSDNVLFALIVEFLVVVGMLLFLLFDGVFEFLNFLWVDQTFRVGHDILLIEIAGLHFYCLVLLPQLLHHYLILSLHLRYPLPLLDILWSQRV